MLEDPNHYDEVSDSHNDSLHELRDRARHARGRMAEQLELLRSQETVQSSAHTRHHSDARRKLEEALDDLDEKLRGWENIDPASAHTLHVWLDALEGRATE